MHEEASSLMKKIRWGWARAGSVGLMIVVLLGGPVAGDGADKPAPYKREPFAFHLSAPITTWDEAVPLGNGLMGMLLWGVDEKINLSLDRGDLWDERLPEIYLQDDWNYGTIKRLVAQRNQAEMVRRFDAPYNNVPYPTKLPGGRLELTLAKPHKARSFTLDMKRAMGSVDLGTGRLQAFVSAVEPVALIRLPKQKLQSRIVRPHGLDKLKYPAADFGGEGNTRWMVQQAAGGFRYAVVVGGRQVGEETLLAATIASTNDGEDPLAVGRKRVSAALEAGFDKALLSHVRWWQDFWGISDVRLPHAGILHHYNLVKYLYGAGSRPEAPPIPLQGVWTRDDGDLPPWKGDFHHDLNTQMTYLAYPTAGLFDAGMSFVNYNWNLLGQYRKFARKFYGVKGAVVPGVATLSGKATAGWAQYSLSPTNGLWVGQTFYLHWRYTMDREFLEQRAYPWLSEAAEAIVDLLEERDGKLYLPLSSSPEIFDNSMRAWLKPNSNYDLALMQWTFEALAEMADALKRPERAERWRQCRGKLDELSVDEKNVLRFAEGVPFDQSHRHHSHMMAIHPLGTLHVEGTERDRQIIQATLNAVHEKGTQAWVGYSFSWFACVLARAGMPELALRYLVDYERAFILRNGFHVNGDQIGAGLSAFRYRPFTLEGNFLATEAVHEMMLQSWGDRLRVFPAVSKHWPEVSFDGLRAQGGFKVSAKRAGGRTEQVRIEATVDQTLRLSDPFPGRTAKWNREDVKRVGDDYVVDMKRGQVLEGKSVEP